MGLDIRITRKYKNTDEVHVADERNLWSFQEWLIKEFSLGEYSWCIKLSLSSDQILDITDKLNRNPQSIPNRYAKYEKGYTKEEADRLHNLEIKRVQVLFNYLSSFARRYPNYTFIYRTM